VPTTAITRAAEGIAEAGLKRIDELGEVSSKFSHVANKVDDVKVAANCPTGSPGCFVGDTEVHEAGSSRPGLSTLAAAGFAGLGFAGYVYLNGTPGGSRLPASRSRSRRSRPIDELLNDELTCTVNPSTDPV
jgi:hypothetical protein